MGAGRNLIDKVVDLKQAASLVRDGDILSLGGMLLYRRPVAFVGELLRQGTTDLTIMGMTAAFESDLLVGAGRVRRVRTCYFGLEGFGLAPMFTAAAQEGRIEVTEESEASIAWGVRAALAGVGFMPSNAWRGTDLASGASGCSVHHLAHIPGETLLAFPALRPNVAVIHAVMADRAGNAVLVGNLAMDVDLRCARIGWLSRQSASWTRKTCKATWPSPARSWMPWWRARGGRGPPRATRPTRLGPMRSWTTWRPAPGETLTAISLASWPALAILVQRRPGGHEVQHRRRRSGRLSWLCPRCRCGPWLPQLAGKRGSGGSPSGCRGGGPH